MESPIQVTVDDPEAPVIELSGNPFPLQQDTPWQEPGFAIKDKDGNPIDTSAIEIVGDGYRNPGTYLTYSFTDDGHQAVPLIRTVEVGDYLPPTSPSTSPKP